MHTCGDTTRTDPTCEGCAQMDRMRRLDHTPGPTRAEAEELQRLLRARRRGDF